MIFHIISHTHLEFLEAFFFTFITFCGGIERGELVPEIMKTNLMIK